MNVEKISWNIQHVIPIRILVMARTILSVSHESNLINMTVQKNAFPMYRNMRLLYFDVSQEGVTFVVFTRLINN